MKPTGYVRKVDDLGRLVIPVEVRRSLGIGVGDGVEVWVSGSDIVLLKYRPPCIFCGATEGLERFRGKGLCRECIGLLAKRLGDRGPQEASECGGSTPKPR